MGCKKSKLPNLQNPIYTVMQMEIKDKRWAGISIMKFFFLSAGTSVL
jgi:hypothetical protein